MPDLRAVDVGKQLAGPALSVRTAVPTKTEPVDAELARRRRRTSAAWAPRRRVASAAIATAMATSPDRRRFGLSCVFSVVCAKSSRRPASSCRMRGLWAMPACAPMPKNVQIDNLHACLCLTANSITFSRSARRATSRARRRRSAPQPARAHAQRAAPRGALPGAQLFVRAPRGVELTPIGVALRARVDRARITLDMTPSREVEQLSAGKIGKVRVGAGHMPDAPREPRPVPALHRRASRGAGADARGIQRRTLPAARVGQPRLRGVRAARDAYRPPVVSRAPGYRAGRGRARGTSAVQVEKPGRSGSGPPTAASRRAPGVPRAAARRGRSLAKHGFG